MAGNSNLPNQRLFKFENYPDAEPWFQPFLQSLNLFVDPVYQILDGGITYQNLMVPKIYNQVITSPVSGPLTFNFVNPLRFLPRSVTLGNVYAGNDTTSHPSLATCVYWHFSQGSIYVTNIPNLTASTQYNITLVIQ